LHLEKLYEAVANSTLNRGVPLASVVPLARRKVEAALNTRQRRAVTLTGAPPHAARLLAKRTKWVAAAAEAASFPMVVFHSLCTGNVVPCKNSEISYFYGC
jgi:hypothetical protein